MACMGYAESDEGYEIKVLMTIGFINRNQGFKLPMKRVFKYANDDWALQGVNRGWILIFFLGCATKAWASKVPINIGL